MQVCNDSVWNDKQNIIESDESVWEAEKTAQVAFCIIDGLNIYQRK